MHPDTLKRIILDQREAVATLPPHYVPRSSENKLKELAANKEIIVITGIRRCGKSVLLNKALHEHAQSDYYFNFEDDRLATFNVDDFQLLQTLFMEMFGIQNTYYFDEIQNIEGWELFVRRLYNNNCKIYITGSNATLFSEELGTRLTGRYITLKVFPFSFYEFIYSQLPELANQQHYSSTDNAKAKKIFDEYCQLGGFPEYVKYQQIDYLHSLYESIVYRDIISRYKITNPKPLREILYYLASNCGKEVTYNSLRKLVGLGSSTTVSDYCGYFENSHLCFLINRYNASLKSQILAPKKIYFIDHALAKTIGFRISEDRGHMLENIVFIELKRRGHEIYYHKMNKECDFLLRQSGKIISAIQICATLEDSKTKAREIDGLVEALSEHSLAEGYILTERDEDSINVQHNHCQYRIHILPVWKWLILD